ncbi:3-oxoacyl-ACP reductase FabG [Blastochloris viridis]|uniref:3-oxoacyl-[acyl-carrier protein] reductase n=1 Tax=Blastochloris viridis TaxID=1079 RepID=A0A0H5BDV7_BLAVI|nr:3-oxoacyl-ACP reductase FabG [Blastochloris viridis]ALK10759.1 3-oxoacyl-[acyl-carrier-protein] reductase FabG [Blastochloris viridis]BAR99274.1 3-oxoacyl-[acyl-carrier protein] reductase [Blastochloris viridis]CUU43421.1 3-oxoacyl-[acyl-carrier-protein] reductase FabG [Blastochloris viridis]
MLQSLAGRVAIVTGGSKGIGRGLSARFVAAGLNVLVVGRSAAAAEAAATALGPTAVPFAADVASETACEAMVKAALARWGRIDVLAANAGIFPAAKLDRMTAAEFDQVIDTNLKGTFLSIKAVLPAMKAAKTGRIVVTSSITGPITGYPGWAHYGASKAGQLGFVRTAAIELAPYGITINAVMPGNIRTEGLDGLGADYIAKMEGSIPMKKLGSVADIANAALFFASDEAAYITGQGLVIDGGQVLPESLMALEEMDVVD